MTDSAVSTNGTPLASVEAEVSPMNIPSSLRMTSFGLVTALGLAFNSVALAQSPPAAPPGPSADGPPSVPAAPAASPQVPVVTQSSRVRAFNPGPGGEVRSLYLQNGSVVDVTPALGGQLGAAVRKGERIRASRPRRTCSRRGCATAGTTASTTSCTFTRTENQTRCTRSVRCVRWRTSAAA
jgi:hypothetical protein